MSLTNIPDFILIEDSNVIEIALTLSGKNYSWRVSQMDIELESRTPHIEPEYDATGQIITSEVMGYTEDGEEIWSF